MTDAKEVAAWMKQELDSSGYLSQASAVVDIMEKFGGNFYYQNDSGNLAIDKEVLKEFKKIKGEQVDWDKYDKAWRARPSSTSP